MVILLKIKRTGFFSTRQHSYFDVTHCANSEVQIVVFSKWNMLREWKLVQRSTFVYLQPGVNKNLWNLAILTLQFDDVTVKTIYCETIETWKICSFVHKASESCYNLNISSVSYKCSLLVSHLLFGYFPKGKSINK